MKRVGFIFAILIFISILALVFIKKYNQQTSFYQDQQNQFTSQLADLQKQLSDKILELETFQKTDQVLLNQKNKEELKSLKDTLKLTISSYENLVDLKGDKKQFAIVDKLFAQILAELRDEKYSSASSTLATLNAEVKKEVEVKVVANVPVQGSPAAAGTQVVKTDNGDFTVRVISADLKSTKVVVETASEHDCADNCPVASLSTLASKSGAFAAINGPYFCPASYPACSSKKNSFDTLMMNRLKVYFNSNNNVYSNVPAAIFSTTSRFVTQSSQWGRDTGVDSVIAGQPLLVFNGQSQFSGDGDPKKSGKGTRAFLGGTDSTVYIGLVYNATTAEMANVVAKIGIKNAINLDSGGSIALLQNGKYLAGPGRDLPFGIMLVRR